MAESANNLFAIEVDTDDYAETAAGDAPSVPRTYQSEADFQAQKATYTAQIDGENSTNNYQRLLKAVPALREQSQNGVSTHENEGSAVGKGGSLVRLSKKDVQLLGYAAGELYFDGEYARLLDLCRRVRGVCQVDGKVEESLSRWMNKCEVRLER